MENFDRDNIDELLKIHQICQHFPCQNFALCGIILLLISGRQDHTAKHQQREC